MLSTFTALDWLIVIGYLLILMLFGWKFQAEKSESSKDYFLGGNQMPLWAVSISVLATTQSAATFLGGPDQGYRGDYTYLAAAFSAVAAALFVTRFLIPKFYAENCTTVYEIIAKRYNQRAMRAAGATYLIGRLLASGARLYLAAIAVSMILFSDIEANNIIFSAFIMVSLGFLVTFIGGIRSVIWSDLIQFIIYLLAALTVVYFLLTQIPADLGSIIEGLKHAPDGQDKLRVLNFDLGLADPFSVISVFTGLLLLNIANSGLDQDTTQRLLTCNNPKTSGRALIWAAIFSIPVIGIFISIGQLLHIYYDRPDLMQATLSSATQDFQGEQITIFMHYILNNIPSGLKGLVTIGVIAAAISTINSGLNSMSSVVVEDFYRPWRKNRPAKEESHYVFAGQLSMGLIGVALFLMSILCYYWQRYTDMPLLEFALSVMTFAYAGLLGVYFTILFTNRGSSNSVLLALAVAFLASTAQQSYIVDTFGLPSLLKDMAFTWKLVIGTVLAFCACQLGHSKASVSSQPGGG